MKKTLFVILALALSAGLLYAADVPMAPVSVIDSQSYGLGGPHAAYTDTIYGVFTNPAAIRKTNRGSALEISAGVPQLFDILGRLANGTGSFSDTTAINLFKDSTGSLLFGPGVNMTGPLAIGYAANGFAFGIWNQIGLDAKITGTTISISAHAEVIAAVTFAAEIFDMGGHSLDAGVTAKPFVRAMTVGLETPRNALQLLSAGFNFDTLLQDAGVPVIIGAGLDAGLMYRWRNHAAVGLTFADIITRGVAVMDLAPTFGLSGGAPRDNVYSVPFKINFGASFQGRLSDVVPSLSGGMIGDSYLAVMADWEDILNQHWTFEKAGDLDYRNPVLNLSFGIELGLFRFLRLRGGLSDMLPAVGLGFRVGPFQIDTSLYGVELGNEPGQYSTYAVNFGISVRPDSKPKSWPWSGPFISR